MAAPGQGAFSMALANAMIGGDMVPFDEQVVILRSGASEVIPDAEFDLRLKESVETGRPLRVKLGLDPTAGHGTLGGAGGLRKLRQVQGPGATPVPDLGGVTARA